MIPGPAYPISEAYSRKRVCITCRAEQSRHNGRWATRKLAQVEVTPAAHQVILGSLLGDGSFDESPQHNSWGLSIKHGLRQQQYCLWKATLLGQLVAGVDWPEQRVRVRTVKHPALTTLALQLRASGRKSIVQGVFDSLGPLGLAVWYFDDGSISPWRLSYTKGKLVTRAAEIRLSANSFQEHELMVLRSIIEDRIGERCTKCTWTYRKNNFTGQTYSEPKRMHGIRLYAEAAAAFIKYISQASVSGSGMEHKLKLL